MTSDIIYKKISDKNREINVKVLNPISEILEILNTIANNNKDTSGEYEHIMREETLTIEVARKYFEKSIDSTLIRDILTNKFNIEESENNHRRNNE
jgi:hypothetical protein